MTGPYFETWSHENLAKFAKDAYVRLQAAPPQRQPLTWEQVNDMWLEAINVQTKLPNHVVYARAIERKHGIGGEHD